MFFIKRKYFSSLFIMTIVCGISYAYDCATDIGNLMPVGQCNDLVAIYNNAGGDSRNNNTTWLATGSNPCDWQGITCDGSFNVTNIDLSNQGLVGTLPVVSNLSTVTGIDLSYNPGFTGTENLYTFTGLEVVYLNNNAYRTLPTVNNADQMEVRKRYFTNNSLSTLPSRVYTLEGQGPRAVELYLDNNKFYFFPSEALFTGVTLVSIKNNYLHTVPSLPTPTIVDQYINFNNNKILRVPTAIQNITYPYYWYFDNNNIRSFGGASRTKNEIAVFHIVNNYLTSMPQIFDFGQVNAMTFSGTNNYITDFSPCGSATGATGCATYFSNNALTHDSMTGGNRSRSYGNMPFVAFTGNFILSKDSTYNPRTTGTQQIPNATVGERLLTGLTTGDTLIVSVPVTHLYGSGSNPTTPIVSDTGFDFMDTERDFPTFNDTDDFEKTVHINVKTYKSTPQHGRAMSGDDLEGTIDDWTD